MIKKVELTSWDTFLVSLSSYSELHLDFFVDNRLIATRVIENNGESLLYHIDEDIEVLGHECVIKTNEFGEHHLDVTKAVDFYDFDARYTYLENDLGSLYYKDHTSFKLWAPLAYRVTLLVNDNAYEMQRIENGVFYIALDGNFDGAKYIYEISMNGESIRVIDPYGKSSSANGEYSFIINPEKIAIDMYNESLPEMNSNLDAIIYEANVRDMTIDDSTNIEYKGKFLGLCERGRTTKGGHPAGFDHIVSLGITHLQLMPVLDFVTVDEANPDKKYNWGYDPQQYFALEGSYATNPNDPYVRIKEFKRLVRDFHRSGVRINLDVVYNHVYEAKTSIFNRVVPNYYFRRDEENEFLDHSYCGNELASERPMVRKLILDSVNYLIDEYQIDGFRFDLMGLMDIETMKEIVRIARSKPKFIMLYGEGWDMGSVTSDGSEFATMGNAFKLPEVAFFNDRYRNIARGIGSRAALEQIGYLLGNDDFKFGFEFVYLGSCFDITYPKLFLNPSQSLNYVECHDNSTLYDVIKSSIEINDIPRLIRKINKCILLSFGIPFIHAGQEVGLTKFNHHNTYNKGDRYNKFDYSVLDKRYDLVTSLMSFIRVRKSIKMFNVSDLSLIEQNVQLIDDEVFHVVITDLRETRTVYHILINNSPVGKRVTFDRAVDYFAPIGYKKTLEKHFLKQVDVSPFQVGIVIEVE